MTVVLTSSTGTKEQLQEVLEKNGYEIPAEDAAAAAPAEETEPKREDFESDEDHQVAVEDWEKKQQDAAEKAEEEEDEEEKEERAAKPKVSKFQKRVNKITSKLQTQIAELKAKLDAKEKAGDGADGKPEEEKDPRPVRANFKSTEEYEDALLAWGTAKAIANKEATDKTNSEKAQLQQNWDGYKAQVEDFREEHDDWDEVVNQDLPMHTGVQLAIMEQENGAEVVYYLGKHPDYAQKLAEMTPLSAVMEVGRLSSRLKAGSPGSGTGNGANNKPKPRVPAPIRPVSSAATQSTSTSRTAAEKRDYKAFKVAQRAGK